MARSNENVPRIRLQTLDDRMLERQHKWASQEDWLASAEAEHVRRSFHAIVARTNVNRKDFVLEGEGLDETHPLWNVPRSRIVARTAREMAACTAPLLRVCKETLFIPTLNSGLIGVSERSQVDDPMLFLQRYSRRENPPPCTSMRGEDFYFQKRVR